MLSWPDVSSQNYAPPRPPAIHWLLAFLALGECFHLSFGNKLAGIFKRVNNRPPYLGKQQDRERHISEELLMITGPPAPGVCWTEMEGHGKPFSRILSACDHVRKRENPIIGSAAAAAAAAALRLHGAFVHAAAAAALFRGEASVTSALISKTSAASRRGEDAERTNRGEGALQIEL
ncbi:hypothetical protein AOLI_G00058980 [Acnodon oligacanthus]